MWADGSTQVVDAVIWCTGFKASLNHLRSLDVVEPDQTVAVNDGRSVKVNNLWLAMENGQAWHPQLSLGVLEQLDQQ